MFFIVKAGNPVNFQSEMPLVYGPFVAAEDAIALAQQFKQPGDYTIMGPAPAVHQVAIAAPVVTSTPIA